ncbi:MAG: Protein-arginine kinase [Chlamydiae bacterium]|nr:Protein-arginine kinase [Chlamydiota bacterium]
MSQAPNLPPSLLTDFPWSQEEGAIWMATTHLLRRNLSRYNFPSKINRPEEQQVLQSLSKTTQALTGIENLRFIEEKDLSSSDQELLFEHFLFLRGVQEPPEGKGILIDETGKFLALLNMGDHLKVCILQPGDNLEKGWHALANIESQIGKKEGFAFSPKFGYLTSDVGQCGTGLTISAFLHLPALISTGQLEGVLKGCEEEELHFLGLAGNLQELVGDVLVVQNNYTLGLSEEAIIHTIQKATTKLISTEKGIRSHIKTERATDVKDLVSKSFGLLVHCYQLETREALDLLSVMKLGLSLGFVKNVSDETLSSLFFKCRRGHLSHLFPEITDPKELAHKRAEFLHHELMGISLSPELE